MWPRCWLGSLEVGFSYGIRGRDWSAQALSSFIWKSLILGCSMGFGGLQGKRKALREMRPLRMRSIVGRSGSMWSFFESGVWDLAGVLRGRAVHDLDWDLWGSEYYC
jgi:hypothetical protein